VWKWGCILVDLSCFEYDFLKYPPLVIAYAALLCAARFNAGVSEHTISARLEGVCSACHVDQADIDDCAEAIERQYQLCFPNAAKERGLSDRSDTTTPTSIMARNVGHS